MKPPVTLQLLQLGERPYAEVWALQQQLQQALVQYKAAARPDLPKPPQYLLVCSHPHVYTLGKSGKVAHLLLSPEALAARGIDYFPVERGGDITYHGPGQLVVYPILDLEDFFTDLTRYLRTLEQAVIDTLAHWGLSAGRFPGYTGVWCRPETEQAQKICAMGIKCSRWVTLHGLALNVAPDLSYFQHIVPCGIAGYGVTSLQAELGQAPPLTEVAARLVETLAGLMGFEPVRAAPDAPCIPAAAP